MVHKQRSYPTALQSSAGGPIWPGSSMGNTVWFGSPPNRPYWLWSPFHGPAQARKQIGSPAQQLSIASGPTLPGSPARKPGQLQSPSYSSTQAGPMVEHSLWPRITRELEQWPWVASKPILHYCPDCSALPDCWTRYMAPHKQEAIWWHPCHPVA